MKRLLLVILMSVLMIVAIPSNVLAKPTRQVLADMEVVAVDRVDLPPPEGFNVSASVKYAGIVTDAVRQSKEDWKKLAGATVSAVETANYLIDQTGHIWVGQAVGTITIIGDQDAVLTISFESEVFGNLFTEATDIGTWKVVSATKSLHQLKDAGGTWSAAVHRVELPGGGWTFVGTAHVVGNF